jgi:hypothetical protein
VDRYRLNGAYQGVTLSARELKPALLPPNAQTWVGRHCGGSELPCFAAVVIFANRISSTGPTNALLSPLQ